MIFEEYVILSELRPSYAIGILSGIACCVLLPAGIARQISFQDVHVEKNAAQRTGKALVTVDGKVKRLARHALQAWPIMEGRNALILLLGNEGEEKGKPHLRFYDGVTKKRRDLGSVPFTSAELKERKQSDGSWALVLSGASEGKPVIIVADKDAIRGELDGAVSPQLGADSLSFRYGPFGETKTVAIKALLGKDMAAIYEAKELPRGEARYVQFLPDGHFVSAEMNKQFKTGSWRTDGEQMIVIENDGAKTEWSRSSLIPVEGVPAGTRLSVRLLQPLASQKIKEGDPVKGVLITPVVVDNKILIPQGSEFAGTVAQSHGVGWALKYETAALTLEFTSVKLPDGTALAVHTRLYEVENSREKVSDQGVIKGIRSTGTLGHSAEGKISSIAAIDPVAYLFTTVSATAALGFAEPEILYPAGTEVIVEFTAPLVTAKVFPRNVPDFAASEAGQEQLSRFVRSLPFRTATKGTNKPSDLTNLMFVGPLAGLKRAFEAAGWSEADPLTANSAFLTMKTLSGNQVYDQAPMSVLELDESPPILTLTKTTDTFSSRHHLRVFDPLRRYEGAMVLTASSTQDIRIAFSEKQKTFIHVIDQYIDNERSKVVNDLVFTGCVEGLSLVPRPWVPQDAYNSTGDRLRTDGAIAVLRMSDCTNPRTTPKAEPQRPNRLKRVTRDTVLTVRNDLLRGNVGYQSFSGIRWIHYYLDTKDQLKPDEGDWRKTTAIGTEFKGLGDLPRGRQSSVRITTTDVPSTETADASSSALENSHRWDPPRCEIGLHGGYFRYPAQKGELVTHTAIPQDLTDPTKQIYVGGVDGQFKGQWAAGLSVTLNTWKWFSNQFTYTYQRGEYQSAIVLTKPAVDLIEGDAGLTTRQFEYNLLLHLRPPTSRWRPYFAAGPALVLTALTDAPIKKAAGPFNLGLQSLGELIAAYDFGRTPPLEGGGVFGLGLVYGGGIKYRVRPRITVSMDFRETWSRNPNLISDSYTADYFSNEGYDVSITRNHTPAKYRQQRFTLGVAFTF